MGKSLEEKLQELSEADRKSIYAEADRLEAEYLTIQELRKAKELTQVQLANELNLRQATIAKMEKRSDLLISTLRNYVEAMGGTLRLVVEFPDQTPISLEGFGDLEDLPKKREGKNVSNPQIQKRG